MEPVLKIEKVVVGSIGTNCYVVKKKNSCFIIDPGGEAEKIKVLIGHALVKFILLTHGHFDHVLALNDMMILYPQATVFVSKQDRKLVEHLSEQSQYLDQKIADVRIGLKTLQDEAVILFEGEKILVMETPGHTFGSLCFRLNDYLFSGDTLFYHAFGRTDLPWSDKELMKQSLEKLSRLGDNVKVFPGHGRETSILEEKRSGVLRNIGV